MWLKRTTWVIWDNEAYSTSTQQGKLFTDRSCLLSMPSSLECAKTRTLNFSVMQLKCSTDVTRSSLNCLWRLSHFHSSEKMMTDGKRLTGRTAFENGAVTRLWASRYFLKIKHAVASVMMPIKNKQSVDPKWMQQKPLQGKKKNTSPFYASSLKVQDLRLTAYLNSLSRTLNLSMESWRLSAKMTNRANSENYVVLRATEGWLLNDCLEL